MIIKRYIVNDMNEAMTRIRYELGKDAIIISQRKVKRPGFWGFLKKRVIEVTATVDNSKEEKYQNNKSLEIVKKLLDKKNADLMLTDKKRNMSNVSSEKNTNLKSNNSINNGNYKNADLENANNKDSLLKEIQEMKIMMNKMINTPIYKENKENKICEFLRDKDIDENIFKNIVAKMETMNEGLDDLEKAKIAIEEMTPISRQKLDGTVVFVGPTGVGKTTTIAKLAGRLALIEKKKVGLITIDTYRIGAVEQLKIYADIMSIPFKVVVSMKDMEQALDYMKDCDTILVDTTGRSSKNAMQISELRAFVDKINTENIHLVMSCTTKNRDIGSIIEGYKPLGYNNVIITKLDETTTYGSILNILQYADKPISFVTAGQNVPDDIKKITAEEISNLILGEDNVC